MPRNFRQWCYINFPGINRRKGRKSYSGLSCSFNFKLGSFATKHLLDLEKFKEENLLYFFAKICKHFWHFFLKYVSFPGLAKKRLFDILFGFSALKDLAVIVLLFLLQIFSSWQKRCFNNKIIILLVSRKQCLKTFVAVIYKFIFC